MQSIVHLSGHTQKLWVEYRKTEIQQMCEKLDKHWKTSFEKTPVFYALASKLNTGWSTKADMVCYSPVGFDV